MPVSRLPDAGSSNYSYLSKMHGSLSRYLYLITSFQMALFNKAVTNGL